MVVFKIFLQVSNSWDPARVRCFVKPDLDPNGLQKLSADDTSRGDRGWLMHFLVFLGYLVNGMTKYDHFCMC